MGAENVQYLGRKLVEIGEGELDTLPSTMNSDRFFDDDIMSG